MTIDLKKKELKEHDDRLHYYTRYIKRKWLKLVLLVLAVFLTTAFACSPQEPWTDFPTIPDRIKASYIPTVDFCPSRIPVSSISN